MENVLQVRVTVRKYFWCEFVHDVIWTLAFIFYHTNTLSKRYLHLSLRQLLQGFYTAIKWGLLIFWIGAWSYLLIRG